MLIKILVVLTVIIAVILLVAAAQPAAFRVTRSATIAAPAAVLFAQVNDLHAWQDFSPWAQLDPAMKNTYAGPRAGVGAALAWDGNSKVGQGRMTITESKPNELIRMKLEFIKPMAATNTTEFTFQAEGDRTLVTWSMAGENNFVGKLFCLFMNMDKMVGGDFERGLANLNALAGSAEKK
ncbi:MAG: SRPBCC family protein [Opitutae bacterium]